MKTAIVSSRQLHVFGRFDAGFHIWVHDLVKGMESEAMEAFWEWFSQTNLKRSALENVLLGAKNEDAAVVAFERYMHVRYVDKTLKFLEGNYEMAVKKFVRRMVASLIAKKQAEVDQQLQDMELLRKKFKLEVNAES